MQLLDQQSVKHFVIFTFKQRKIIIIFSNFQIYIHAIAQQGQLHNDLKNGITFCGVQDGISCIFGHWTDAHNAQWEEAG